MFQSLQQQQQQQQLLQKSSFTYFPNSSDSIANSLFSFPQPPTLHSQHLLLSPGSDPHYHTGHFALTHVGFEAQPQFFEHPNADSQSWITKQASPVRYAAAALNSSSNSDWMNQSLVNNVIIGSTQNQLNLIQPVWCEVCNIEFKTKDVYEKHLMGVKHHMNCQVKANPFAAAIFLETSNAINNLNITGQTSNVSGNMIFGASSVPNVLELERKKQNILNAGAAVGSLRMCTVCNVACNSNEAFTKHLSGRRHAAQAGLVAVDGIGPYLAAIRANSQFWNNKGKKATKINQSRWCDVCKITCNSVDVYAKHVSGKKHMMNLEILEKSRNGTCDSSLVDTPAATNLIIGPMESPAANDKSAVNVQTSERRMAHSEATKEDLETKKSKVLQGGAAASAIRVCTICNVVCNSQKVFIYHLTGQKHADMVKKQADARMPTAENCCIKT